MDKPLIDVLMVNRNHEATIAESAQSVLSQTWENVRLIIVDDASTDGSIEALSPLLGDPRVELHRLSENRHICAATNYGFSLVRAKWLARIDSDDLWYPKRLESQMDALSANPGLDVCFSWCDFIDERNRDVRDLVADLPEAFEPTYRTQREWLRHFYYHCNCLIHSSVLMRTSLMRDVGGFELTYRQLHDFDYWVRIAKQHNILIVPERLVAMRKFVGDAATNENASLASRRNVIRTFNEYLDIRAHFFEGMPNDVFLDAFREDFIRPDSTTLDELACEKALLLCRPQDNWNVNCTPAGLRALKDLYAHDGTRRLLETRYNMPVQHFYEMATESLYNDLVVKSDASTQNKLVSLLRHEGDELRTGINALNGEIESLRGHVRALESLVDERDAEIAALRDERDSLRAEIDNINSSSSWRVTKPLRALVGLVRGGRRDANGGTATEHEPVPTAPVHPCVLVQAHLSGNLGDDLFVRTLCTRYPEAEFRLCVDGNYEGRFSDIPNLELRPTGEFGSLVSSADAVVHISGSCFIRDSKNIDAFFAADRFLVDHAQRLYLIGCNFGPYEDDSILEAYRELFRGYDGITFRDRYSAGLFRGYPNVAYAPDVLFGYPARILPKRRRALVCPISLEGREGTFGISGYAHDYRSFSLGVIRALLQHDHEVTLVSFNQSQGDEREIKALLAELKDDERESVETLRYRTRPEEVVPAFEDADCVVATRFHSMVLGMVHGCRVLPVVYDQKTQKVLDDLGNPHAIQLEGLSEADPDDEVAHLLESDPLDVEPLAAASEGQFQFLDRLLEKR